MSAKVVQFYLTLRNAVKLYHWNTLSYPRHKASDKLVASIDKITDSFVEVYIGRYGRDEALGKDMSLGLPGLDEKHVDRYLKDAVEWLTTQLPKLIKPTDTDLLNIRDELIAAINQTLYLFTLR
jgi:hypothetical protein